MNFAHFGNTVCLILVSPRCLDSRTRQKMITGDLPKVAVCS